MGEITATLAGIKKDLILNGKTQKEVREKMKFYKERSKKIKNFSKRLEYLKREHQKLKEVTLKLEHDLKAINKKIYKIDIKQPPKKIKTVINSITNNQYTTNGDNSPIIYASGSNTTIIYNA